jgi:carboxypeptidase T
MMKLFDVQIVADSFKSLGALSTWDLDLKQRAARKEDENRFVIPGILTAKEITKLEAAGYRINVIDDLSVAADERRREVSAINRFAEAKRVSDMAARSVEGYMTAQEVEEAMANLSDQHPGLATLIELPNRTWEDRLSHAVCLGDLQDTQRPAILFTGSMHAREWGGSDICTSFLINLLNAYETNSALQYGGTVFSFDQIQGIFEDLNIFVFPDVNPDGKHHSQTVFPMWRKNRNPNSDADPRYPGVDLNRNFDFLWTSGIGTSANPATNIYKGEGPFSEPETRNVRYLLDTHAAIGYYVDIHSYSELILYSWGDDDNQSIDRDQTFFNPEYDGTRGELEDLTYREYISPMDQIVAVGLARRMNTALAAVRGGRGYTVQESSGLYPTTATSTDYAFGSGFEENQGRKIQGWTIEFGKEFIPPYGEMRKVIMEVCAAMTELCWSVGA